MALARRLTAPASCVLVRYYYEYYALHWQDMPVTLPVIPLWRTTSTPLVPADVAGARSTGIGWIFEVRAVATRVCQSRWALADRHSSDTAWDVLPVPVDRLPLAVGPGCPSRS